MAPKPKAKSKAKQPPKQKAAPKGLQLSGAQWKAYNAAYNSAASAGFKTLALQQRRQAFQAAVNSLIGARLQAAHKLQAVTAKQHAVARAAAIAQFAVAQSYRQSKLAHQNAALQQRIFADYERHIQLTARAQYAYKGEKAFTHTAVLRTLTVEQATEAMTAAWAKAAKAAKKASASTVNQPASAAFRLAEQTVLGNARTAGLAAAAKVPKPPAPKVSRAPRTAPSPSGVFPAWTQGKWHGNPEGRDCIAAAVANSLHFSQGLYITDSWYDALADVIGYARPSLYHGLLRVMHRDASPVQLETFKTVDPVNAAPGHVIGFDTTDGIAHAALLLAGGLIASWSDTYFLADVAGGEIDEAWELTWVQRM